MPLAMAAILAADRDGGDARPDRLYRRAVYDETGASSARRPAREVSMMIAAFLAPKLLDEGDVVRRVAYAGLIAAGVVCLVWT